MLFNRCSIFLCLMVLCAFSPAGAHEFIVVPSASKVTAGEPLSFGVSSSHVFMQSMELEKATDVQVHAKDGQQKALVPLTANAETATYDGQATFTSPGYAYLLGHRLPQAWSMTPEGFKAGGKESHPDAAFTNVYEKFAKTLIVVGEADDGWQQSMGHKLEIIPMADPATYRAGDEFPFLIQFNGQPLATEVFATCDGITATPNSYAWYTQTKEDGVASVRFSQPGLWMIRVQHKDQGKDGVREHVLRAVLVFSVS